MQARVLLLFYFRAHRTPPRPCSAFAVPREEAQDTYKQAAAHALIVGPEAGGSERVVDFTRSTRNRFPLVALFFPARKNSLNALPLAGGALLHNSACGLFLSLSPSLSLVDKNSSLSPSMFSAERACSEVFYLGSPSPESFLTEQCGVEHVVCQVLPLSR